VAPAKKIVAATIWPVSDIVRQIAGSEIEVYCILPAYASPHTFQPSPKDLVACYEAVLYFKVGRGLDDWVDALTKQSRHAHFTVADLSAGCPSLSPEASDDPTAVAHHEHEHENSHHTASDPHVWMDPTIVSENWIPAIVRHLTEIFPEQQAVFAKNALSLQAALRKSDEEAASLLQDLPSRRILVVHSSLTYFARRYHLEVVAVLEPWPGKTPSPKYLQNVMELARKAQVKAIFIEPQLSKNAAAILAKELKLEIGTIDPCSVINAAHHHYQDLLVANAREIRRTLLAAAK
jgi:zinc transport system substrate-binding protein